MSIPGSIHYTNKPGCSCVMSQVTPSRVKLHRIAHNYLKNGVTHAQRKDEINAIPVETLLLFFCESVWIN
jgi:hypothetical protein